MQKGKVRSMLRDVAADKDAGLMATAEQLAGWQELAELMTQQRDMLLRRDHGGLTELNGLVAARLGEQAAPCLHGEFAAETPRTAATARLDELRRNVRNQAQINYELAGDALAHAEFLLEVLYPQARSPVYDEGGKVNGCHVSAAVDWEA